MCLYYETSSTPRPLAGQPGYCSVFSVLVRLRGALCVKKGNPKDICTLPTLMCILCLLCFDPKSSVWSLHATSAAMVITKAVCPNPFRQQQLCSCVALHAKGGVPAQHNNKQIVACTCVAHCRLVCGTLTSCPSTQQLLGQPSYC